MENQKLRRPLASLTMLCLVITQFTTGVFPIPIAPIESAYATNVVTLGSSYESVRIGDSLSPSSVPSVLEQDLNCDSGDVVTSIFFIEADSGNYQDSIDAVGIGCSPLRDDGSIDFSNEEDKKISGDFSGNSSNVERVTCPSGSAASVVKYRGLTYSTGISDHTDSVTLVCRSIDNNGVGSIVAEPSFPSLRSGNNQSDVYRACSSGGLLTGITYDHFNPNRNEGNHPVDLVDSIALFRCRPVELTSITPSLDITKTGPSNINAGDTVTYEISVRNNGTVTANDIRVYDFFLTSLLNRWDPPPFTYVSSTGASCTYSATNAYVSCDIGNLSVGATKNITITFQTPTNQYCGETIMNQADAHVNFGQGTPASDWDKHMVTVNCLTPNLDITKSSNKTSVTKGSNEEIIYTINITNSGNGAASNLYVTDAIPTGLTYNDGASDSRCNQSGNDVVCGPIALNAGGANTSIALKYTVNNYAPCGNDTIRNTAQLRQNSAGGTVVDTSNETQTDVLCPVPILDITKSSNKTSVTKGSNEEIIYTLSVANTGIGDANNLVITDAIPTGLTYNDAASDNRCNQSGNDVVCGPFDTDAGTTEIFTLKYNVNNVAPCGNDTIRNTAKLRQNSAGGTVLDTSNETQTDVLCPVPILDITKSSNKTSVTKGSNEEIIYTIQITNSGIGAANNLYVTDAIPTGLTYNDGASDSRCNQSGNDVVCGPIALNAGGANTSIALKYTVNNYAPCGNDTIRNTAVLKQDSAYGTTLDTSNETQTDVLCPVPILDITKTVDDNTINLGEDITYTLVVTNNGTGLADDTTVTDAIPNGFTYNDGASDNRCNQVASNVICGPVDLSAGASTNFTINFTATYPAICDSTVINRAYAEALNNSVTYSNTVDVYVSCPRAVLDITKVADKSTVEHNDLVTFTINVDNTSVTDAQNIRVIDPIPGHLLYQDASSDALCNQVGNNVVCGPFDLSAGNDRDIDLVFTVLDTAPCSSIIANRADLTADNADSDWSNQVNLTVYCPQPSFTATKSADASTYNTGEKVEYDIVVTNTGDIDLVGTWVIDTIPTGLTFLENDPNTDADCAQFGNQVRCGDDTIPVGGSDTYTLVFEVNNYAPCNGYIDNRADIAFTGNNSVTGSTNNSRINILCPQAQLRATKVANVSTVERGGRIEYTINVENISGVDADNVTITDNVPSHLTYVDAASDALCSISVNTVSCGAFDLAAGDDRDFILVFDVGNTAPCGGSIVNIASAAGDNAAIVWTPSMYVSVFCPNPNFTASKTANLSTITIGEKVEYDIVVTNTGNVDLVGTWVLDTIPTGLTFLENDPNTDADCALQGNQVRCGDDTIPVGGSDTYTLVFEVNDTVGCSAPIDNSAQIVFTGNNGISGYTNTARIFTYCPPATLITTKTADRSAAEVNDLITYTINVSNTSGNVARNVSVSDTIPDHLMYLDANSDAACDQVGNTVECGPLTTLAGGANQNFDLVFKVLNTAPCGTTLTNYAISTSDNAYDARSADVDVSVFCPNADIRIFKTADKAALPGNAGAQLITYSIEAENIGNILLTGISVTDAIPANTTYVDASSDARCDQVATDVVCTDTAITIGTTSTFNLVFSVDTDAFCGTQIQNMAFVSTTQTSGANTNTVTTPIGDCTNPDLEVIKNGPTTVIAGDPITYSIRVMNNGSGDADGVVLVDNFAGGAAPFTYISSTGDTCTQNAVSKEVTCAGLGTIAAGGFVDITLTFQTPANLYCSAYITNTADADVNGVSSAASGSDDHVTQVLCPRAVLTSTKIADATVYEFNDLVTYTINVENTSTTDALNVLISDSIPTNLMYLDANSDAACAQVGNDVKCGPFGLAAGDDQDFILVFKVLNTAVCDGTILNQGEITADNANATWTNQASITVYCPQININATKTVNKSSVDQGDNLTYTISVENTGNTDAVGLTIEDTIPTGLTFNNASSDSRCSESAGVITCGTFDLAINATDDFDLVFTVNNAAVCDSYISNTATVKNALGGIEAGTNSASTLVQCPVASFTAVKSADVSSSIIGDNIVYTIDLHNTGNVSLTGLWIIDAVPVGLTFLENDPATDTRCFLQGNAVKCGDDPIAAGASDSYDIVFAVNNYAHCGTDVTNVADILFTGNGISGQTNTVSTPILCDNAELVATKTADTSTVQYNEFVTYTINVENISGTHVDNVTVVDLIPNHLMYIDAQSDALCDLNGTSVECGPFDLAAGANRDLDLVFKVLDTAPCGSAIANLADINADNAAPSWSNQEDITVNCPQPGISVRKIVDLSTLSGGSGIQEIEYAIEVNNTGLADLTNIEVLDAIPAGLTYLDGVSDSRCDEVSGNIECDEALILPGQDATFVITFEVDTDVYCGQTVSNYASVTTDQTTNILTNTVTTAISNCPTNPNFTATKTASDTTVEIGDTFHYTIALENTGGAELTGLWIIDQIPAGLTFIDASPTNPDCFLQGNAVKCGDDPIAVGATATYDIYFTVNNYAQCGTIDNIAQILFLGNNLDEYTNTERITVACPDAQLEVTKTANVSQADIGDTISYTIRVDNTGTTDAINVDVFDSIINEFTFRSDISSTGCIIDNVNNEISCGSVDIAAGGYAQYTIAFDVNSYAVCGSTIYNQAEAIGDNAGPALSNSESVDIICATPEADLEIEKTGDSQIMRGGTLVYQLLVTNNGPDDAQDVTITDFVPDVQIQDTSNRTDLIFNAAQSDSSCTQVGNTITCPGFDIDAGDDLLINVAFDVPFNAHCAKPIRNYAEVWATTFDPISANNDDEHYATVICATSTLNIEKVGPAVASKGDLITYTVRVENNLGYDTTRNRMIDPIPGHLEYVSANDTSCYKETQTNEVICGEFDLAAGDFIEFQLTFRVKNTAICNRNIINIADVWSNHPGVNPEWSNAVSTKVLCDAVLEISKTDNRTTIDPGQYSLYEILVGNTSSSDAQNVTIVDTLPSNFVFSNASAGGVYNASSRTVTWVIDIDAFDTEILSVSGAANANAQSGNTLLNQVCIQNGACASDTTTVTGNQTPIFRIVKTDHRSTVKPGETLTYEIVVSNISNTDAPTVEVIDTLPQHVTFVSTNGGGVFNNNGEVRWSGGLDANSSVILEVVVTVNSTAPDNFFLLNQVEITGGPSDDDITKVVLDPIAEGCIDIKKETFTANGTPLTPVTQFTFKLDGGTQTVLNDSLGNARFINVPVGNHTITETIPAGWTQENVTPAGGIVSVPAGSTCATVTFKNKQVAVGTAQFTISKTDNLATAEPGDTLTYRMEIRNISTIDATNVEVKDTVPDYTEFISANEGGSKNGNTVTWVFTIAAGATKSFEMRVNVEENADDGDVIFNQVRITDGPSATDTTRIEDDNDNDDNDDNDDDDTDIRVTINDDPDPIDICNDDDLEYEIRLTNSSNSNEEVDVIAILDSDTDYQSSSDGGKEKSGDRVEWDNVKVSRNSNRTLRLRVRVESGARDGDTLRLRVGVSDGDEDTEVTRVRNNGCADDDDEGTPSTTPDLTIDKTANTSEALAGSAVSYTITIRNTGGSDISDAILTDDYPEQYVDITDTGGGSDAGGRLTWNLGTLRSNSTTVVRYNVRLKPGVTRGTTIRNTATVRSGTITRTDDHVIVVPTPPQTGLGGFIKSLTQSESYLSEVNTETSTLVAVVPQPRIASTRTNSDTSTGTTTNLPLVIWITTMMTGLGMGGMFGRKFLF